MIGAFVKKRKHTHTEHPVKVETGSGVMQLQAKECQRLPATQELEEAWSMLSLRVSRGNQLPMS